MLSEIIIDEYTIKNPFKNLYFLEIQHEEYDIEWLLKSTSVHFWKLLNTVENIIEAQKYIMNKDNKDLRVYDDFSMSTFLEYFYIKKSTIIDLLDILYLQYFSTEKKNKKDIEKMIIDDLEHSDMKGFYVLLRNNFKKTILETRNRIIHDKGYSIRVFKKEDNIFAFEIADSKNDTILNEINSVFSYYNLDDIGYHTPLMILTNYTVYQFFMLYKYIEIMIDLIINKANIDTNIEGYKEALYESQKYIYSSRSLHDIKEKLLEIKELLESDLYWEKYVS